MRFTRLLVAACLPIAAIGIAVARGRKEEEEAAPAAPPAPLVEAAAEAPPAPPAPALFPDGLPVVLPGLPSGLSSLSAQGCNACHYAAHDAWLTSRHARAWTSSSYQAALRSAGGSTACLQCHLPLAAQHDELAAGYVDGDLSRPRLSPNPAFDLTLRAEGVTCAACHVRGDTIIGTRPAPDAPHPVAVSDELTKPELCATCHQLTWPGADRPFYDTYEEWRASRWGAAGVTCQDCHMAPTAGAPLPGSDGSLPSHAFTSDPARAISVLIGFPSATIQRGQDATLSVTVQNTGAGHSFPTGNPFKVATVEIALVDSTGKDLAPAWATTFARTVEPTSPWRTTADNRLLAGGQWTGSHTFSPSTKGAAGLGAVEVRLTMGTERQVLRRLPVEVK